MASGTADYTPDARSKGNRFRQRTKHERDRIDSIINATPLLHVAFNSPTSDPSTPSFPTILPMLGAIASYDSSNSDPHIYLHGSSAARLFRLTQDGPLPLTVSATLLDGYVLALNPFHNSCNYRSVVAFGHAELVTDPEELLFALKLITNNTVPDRWENGKPPPPSPAELKATGVLRVRVETASVKTRAGGPGDDRADLADEKLVERVWTGVVPRYDVLGSPVAAESNRVERVPEYLADWVADANGMAEQRAVDAAVEG